MYSNVSLRLSAHQNTKGAGPDIYRARSKMHFSAAHCRLRLASYILTRCITHAWQLTGNEGGSAQGCPRGEAKTLVLTLTGQERFNVLRIEGLWARGEMRKEGEERSGEDFFLWAVHGHRVL